MLNFERMALPCPLPGIPDSELASVLTFQFLLRPSEQGRALLLLVGEGPDAQPLPPALCHKSVLLRGTAVLSLVRGGEEQGCEGLMLTGVAELCPTALRTQGGGVALPSDKGRSLPLPTSCRGPSEETAS